MKVLVTGGAGLIGSRLVHRLVEQGDEVLVLDDLSTGSIANLSGLVGADQVHFELGTVIDSVLVDRCVEDVDRVYHLAGTVGVRRVMDEPLVTIRDIVRGSEVVFEACARYGSRTFLASTSEVYGLSLDLGVAAGNSLSEDDYSVLGSPINRRWAYAAGKLLDEFLALGHANENGLEVIVGRLFNTVGPGQTGRFGMVIPRFVEAALAGTPIVIYGNGRQRRSFLHVEDAADAILKLMDTDSALGRIFNIGSSDEISICELAELVNEAVGSDAGFLFETYESAYGIGFEDMKRRSANTDRIREAISWRPTRGIKVIVDDVVAARAPRAGQKSISEKAAAGPDS